MYKRITFLIAQELLNRLLNLFPKSKTITEILIQIIKDYIQRKEHLKIEDKCQALQYRKGMWVCVWYRYNKPPLIKELSKDVEDVLNICDACKRTKKIHEERKAYRRIMAEGISLRIPYCNKGGKVSEDLKRFYCPDLTEWVDLKWCIRRERGANCRWLGFVTVRKKLKDKDKEVY